MHEQHDLVLASPSACLSVILQVATYLREYTYRQSLPPPLRSMTYFFSATAVKKSKGTPLAGTLNTWGWGKLRFSTEVPVHLENGMR